MKGANKSYLNPSIISIALFLGLSTFFGFKYYFLQREIGDNKLLLKRALETELNKIDHREYFVEKIFDERLNKSDSVFFRTLLKKIQEQNIYISKFPEDKVELKLNKAFEINDSISYWFNTFSYCPPYYIKRLYFFNPLPKEYEEGEEVTFNFFVTYFKEIYFSGKYIYEGSSDSAIIENGENTFRYNLKVPNLSPNERRKPFKKDIKLYFKNHEINKRDTFIVLLKFDIVPKGKIDNAQN